jgi:cytochrome c oxidase assembly protein subunit 15
MTALSGGFVAGLDAGFSYNTFPLMEGKLVPDGLFVLDPLVVNLFENVAMVQFTHRWLALSVLAAVAAFWIGAKRARLVGRRRLAADVMAAVAAIQVGLGVSTLVLAVPVPLAAAHQAGAMVLFCASLWAVHESMRGGEAPRRDAKSSRSNGTN